jgi:hypothetical protein
MRAARPDRGRRANVRRRENTAPSIGRARGERVPSFLYESFFLGIGDRLVRPALALAALATAKLALQEGAAGVGRERQVGVLEQAALALASLAAAELALQEGAAGVGGNGQVAVLLEEGATREQQ